MSLGVVAWLCASRKGEGKWTHMQGEKHMIATALASFPGSRALAEEREPGTYCRLHKVLNVCVVD